MEDSTLINRKVGFLLGFGILVLPWIFSLVLIRKGYSTKARIIAFGWLSIVLFSVISNTQKEAQEKEVSAPTANAESVVSQSPAKPLEKVSEEKKEPEFVQFWDYYEFEDKMGRGKVKLASVKSKNTIEFGFPYSGSQKATLQLRVHPKLGKDVMLTIEKGQFLCNLNGCNLTLKFDQGSLQVYHASEPADHSTDCLFINNYERLISKLRKSQKLYIEAQFYQEGLRVFEFDVNGLNW